MSTSTFAVYVVPGSSQTGPAGTHGGAPRLRVKSPPTDGRANSEAQRTLGRLLGTKVRLVRGTRARRKTFSAELSKATLESRLRRVFGV